MRDTNTLLAMITFFVVGSGSVAGAHTRLKPGGVIPPRSASSGIKTGPCGDLTVAPHVTPATLTAGSTITVEWEETIQHPGHFEIYFSAANDLNFQLLKMIPDDQNGTNNLPHAFSTTLTVPNTPCAACTIQMIQVMTENPAAPKNYYNCGDIKIVSATNPTTPMPTPTPNPASPTPTGNPAPTPTPAPGMTSATDCH